MLIPKNRKKSFLLLELMIGLTLLTLLLVPFAVGPYKLLRVKKKAIIMLELQRYAQNIAIDMKEDLFLEKVKLKSLKEGPILNKSNSYYESVVPITINSLEGVIFYPRVFFRILKKSDETAASNKEKKYYVLEMKVYFTDKKPGIRIKLDPHFVYKFTVESS